MGEQYKQIRLLGEGAFGKCYLVENKNDASKYVVKQIDISKMNPTEKREALKECKILQAFDHPNIIKCHESYTTKNGKLCIVMDFADGGDLEKQVRGQRGKLFQEQQVLDWLVQMCLALKHIHDRKVLHRDIKCQNVFLTKENYVKFGDFGIARVLSSTRENARTMVGTPYYLSPEIVQNQPYSFKSDIWSLGVVLYELCTLKPPFDASSLHFLALKIVRGAYPPLPPHFSRDIKDLVKQMLSTTPSQRPTIGQILRKPFIRQRIQKFLSETIISDEFSHTALHQQRLLDPKPVRQEERKQGPSRPPENRPVIQQKPAESRQPPYRDDGRKPLVRDVAPPPAQIKRNLDMPAAGAPSRPDSRDRPNPPAKIVQQPEPRPVPKKPQIQPKGQNILVVEPAQEKRVSPARPPEYKPPPKPPSVMPEYRPPPKHVPERPAQRQQNSAQDGGMLVNPFMNDKPQSRGVKKRSEQVDIYKKQEIKRDSLVSKKIEEMRLQREREQLEKDQRKQEYEKQKQEKIKQREEMRKKMRADIKKKKQQGSKQSEEIQWMGNQGNLISNDSLGPSQYRPASPPQIQYREPMIAKPPTPQFNMLPETYEPKPSAPQLEGATEIANPKPPTPQFEQLADDSQPEQPEFSYLPDSNVQNDQIIQEPPMVVYQRNADKYAIDEAMIDKVLSERPASKQSNQKPLDQYSTIEIKLNQAQLEYIRMIQELKDAMDQPENDEDSPDPDEQQMPQQNLEIISEDDEEDRDDEIENSVILPPESYDFGPQEVSPDAIIPEPITQNDSSGFSKLELLRIYLEEKLGAEALVAAYNVIKQYSAIDEEDWGYENCYAKLTSLMTTEKQKEYLPLIHTLIFMEEYAEGIV